MKFLCDQMLQRLGRWLIAAGYDTEIVKSSIPDRQILERAVREKRLLLTRDRHFIEMKKDPGAIIWIRGNTLSECIHEVTNRLNIDWMMNPFSRCTICNQELDKIDASHPRIPKDIERGHRQFWLCRSCGRVYWEGSHTRRMRETLKFFNKK